MIKSLANNCEIAFIPTSEVSAKYSLEFLVEIEDAIVNYDSRVALVVVRLPTKFLPGGSRCWIFKVDLFDMSFQMLDLTIKEGDILEVKDFHLIIKKPTGKIADLYYFDQGGSLTLIERIPITKTETGDLQTIFDAFIYVFNTKYYMGYKDKVLVIEEKENKLRFCSLTTKCKAIGIYTEEDLQVFDINSNMMRKFQVRGICRAALDNKGEICFVIVYDKSTGYCLQKITLYQDCSFDAQNTEPLGSHRYDKMYLELDPDCTCVLVYSHLHDSDTNFIKVYSSRNRDLLYTIDKSISHFQFSTWFDRILFDADKVSAISKNASFIMSYHFDVEKDYRKKRQKLFRLGIFSHLNSLDNSEQGAANTRASMDQFINSAEPVRLAKDKGLFLILANLRSPELLLIYIQRCTLKRLAHYGLLIEWMFSNFNQGKVVRRLVHQNFNDAFSSSIYLQDNLDFQIFDRLIKYRYTPKLLREPEGRSIFLRLLRVPLIYHNLDKLQPVTVDIGDDDLDEDYDTAHYLFLGDSEVVRSKILRQDIKNLKKKLRNFKGNNLKPYQLFISSVPFQLAIGNKHCTELFKLLDQCPGEELNELLRPLIYLQWRKIYPFAFVYMVIFWIFSILSYIFFGFHFKNRGLGISIIVMSSFLFIYEFLGFRAHRRKYIRSPWNIVDLIAMVGSIVLVPLMWTQEVETQGWAVGRSIILTIIWIRALTWLRVFRAVRHLITMVLRVFYDMIAYLTILVSSVFCLAFIWRLSFYFPPDGDVDVYFRETHDQVPTFFSSVQTVTMIILGNMPSQEADGRQFSVIKFLVTIAFGIILALALTNLLIAIIGQTYSDIEATKKIHDLREVIGLIIDFNGTAEGFFNCKMFQKREFVLSIHKAEDSVSQV